MGDWNHGLLPGRLPPRAWAGKGLRVPERAEALHAYLAAQLKPPFGFTRLEAERPTSMPFSIPRPSPAAWWKPACNRRRASGAGEGRSQ